MKLDLADQSNIDGCINLKGNKIIIAFYLKFICLMLTNHDLVMQIRRFMGDSKRVVKNKARVEGSICTSYLHRETTHFCSHYFNNFMLLSCNIMNQI